MKLRGILLFAILTITILSIGCIGGGGGGLQFPEVAQITGLTDESGNTIPDGGTATERVQTLQGTVQNPEPTPSSTEGEFHGEVVLVFNNEERYVEVWDDGTHGDTVAEDDFWTYAADLVLKRGVNTFKILVENDEAHTVGQSKVFTITADVPVMDIRAVLTWDTNENDVDLHIYDPDGYHAWYSDFNGIPGGQLDLDDVDGYGPETYTEEDAESGTYTLEVRYYDDKEVSSPVIATVRLTVNEGATQTFTHTFTQSQANADDSSNDWTVTTFTVPGA